MSALDFSDPVSIQNSGTRKITAMTTAAVCLAMRASRPRHRRTAAFLAARAAWPDRASVS